MSESIGDTPGFDDDLEEVREDEESDDVLIDEEDERSFPEVGSDDNPGSMLTS